MNKASHEQVIQTANINLASIRGSEVSYFNVFFSNFATQSIFVATCIIQSVSQLPALTTLYVDDDDYSNSYTNSTINGQNATEIGGQSVDKVILPTVTNYVLFTVYWCTSAIAFSASMFVLLNTIFVSVFGQGLALRGPVGSMIIAINGMAQGQSRVLNMFIFFSITFGINVGLMCWVVMDPPAAITCDLLILIGMYWWYRNLIKIYNKFKLSYSEGTPWDEGRTESLDTISPTFNAMHDNNKARPIPGKAGVVSQSSVFSGTDCISNYVSMKMSGSSKRVFGVVVKGSLYLYKDKDSFEKSSSKQIRNRPVLLSDHKLSVVSAEPPFKLSLVPQEASEGHDGEDKTRKKAVLEFTCDSAAEMTFWINAFKQGIAYQE